MAKPNTADGDRTESRIAMRISPAHKLLIERAAAARGLSITDYMTSLALADAQQVLAEQTLFVLDDETYARVAAMMDRPARVVPGVERLLKGNRRKPWKVDHGL